MALDAALAADPLIDFTPFDNDGDGFVDAYVIIHAGRGAEETGNGQDIWSHKWILPNGAIPVDATQIFGYLTVPEDCKLGVCAHELGHLLFGFPDLYDTDNSSEGNGNWCLMAGGSWNGGGDTPAHPSAWCKVQQNWAPVITPTGSSQITLDDVKENGEIIHVSPLSGNKSEYFLIENRQKTQFDRALPGEGLLVWHVDDNVPDNKNENHPKVALLQADGNRDLESAVNRGDDGDPYPGSSSNMTIDANSNPNSHLYSGADSRVRITHISSPGSTMTFDLNIGVTQGKKHRKVEDAQPTAA
jgi:immune inhibitor A